MIIRIDSENHETVLALWEKYLDAIEDDDQAAIERFREELKQYEDPHGKN